MSDFVRIPLSTQIGINNIVTMHFFTYEKEFVFEGELHDFWELVCIYEGSATVSAGNQKYNLKEGGIVFHEPNEFHSIHTNSRITTKIIVITFDSSGDMASLLKNKVAYLNEHDLDILNDLLDEGKKFFDLSNSNSQLMMHRENLQNKPKNFQTLKNLLEIFLLGFIDSDSNPETEKAMPQYNIVTSKKIIQNTINILNENIRNNISIMEICSILHISRSYLCTLFKKHTGKSIVDYSNTLKINEAKKAIANGDKNITEIAENLGYSSIHYFSRIFKQYTGMSPLNYLKITEDNNMQ